MNKLDERNNTFERFSSLFGLDAPAATGRAGQLPLPLAMAYVPPQKWTIVYDNAEGLRRGTIFPALDDVVLFLDLNPTNEQALAFYHKNKAVLEELTRKYNETFGPLTDRQVQNKNCWTWLSTPMTWEGE